MVGVARGFKKKRPKRLFTKMMSKAFQAIFAESTHDVCNQCHGEIEKTLQKMIF
jgi:hypothetical protein